MSIPTGLFGIPLKALPGERSAPLLAVAQGVNDGMFKVVSYVMA